MDVSEMQIMYIPVGILDTSMRDSLLAETLNITLPNASYNVISYTPSNTLVSGCIATTSDAGLGVMNTGRA